MRKGKKFLCILTALCMVMIFLPNCVVSANGETGIEQAEIQKAVKNAFKLLGTASDTEIALASLVSTPSAYVGDALSDYLPWIEKATVKLTDKSGKISGTEAPASVSVTKADGNSFTTFESGSEYKAVFISVKPLSCVLLLHCFTPPGFQILPRGYKPAGC